MKVINEIIFWLCLMIGAFFVALFIYSCTVRRQFDPVLIMYVVGAVMAARVFRNKNRSATKSNLPK